MLHTLALAAWLTVLLIAPVAAQAASAPLEGSTTDVTRTDHSASGNRVARASGPLIGETTEIELGDVASWVLPDPTDRGRSWLVVSADGSIERIIVEPGQAAEVLATDLPQLVPGEAPVAVTMSPNELIVRSALEAAGSFDSPLPDGRVTHFGDSMVALAQPTTRYPHGVLGDDLEAASMVVHDAHDRVRHIDLPDAEVIEGTSAMFVALPPGEGEPWLLVTISDAEVGARLRAYDLEGAVVAESAAIGRGFRWLHQIGAGVLAVDGEAEIIAVRTPHIGGVVEAYRVAGDRLVPVASIGGYSSHRLGSANLDMALLADATGNGRLEVVVPAQDMRSLALLARTPDGFAEAGRLDLGGELATNVAATSDDDGRLVLAAGTADGRLRIFR